jgi:hypothetical protein
MTILVGLIFAVSIFVVLPYLMFFDDKKKNKKPHDKADSNGGHKKVDD